MKPKRLRPEDREFFQRIELVVLADPFDDPPDEVRQIIGADSGSSGSGSQFLYWIKPALSERVQQLKQKGLANLDAIAEQDRVLATLVFSLNVYLHYVETFDQLINDQLERPEHSINVPFAKRALSELANFGFSNEDALRYLAFFYQFRRAFYFIGRTLIGNSQCMKRFRRALWNSVFSYNVQNYVRYLWSRMEDFSTLLLGETGVGKGVAAAAIGRSGFIPFDAQKNRFAYSFTQTFIEINLSQFPENLVESELFGHRKGAFTGAVDKHQGMLSRCSSYGSVFLDEIGDVSKSVQIKLLKVLQERSFSPVGDHSALRFKGRVIAAANQSLATLRENQRYFRDDFYYRLCSDVITVPPLRQRIQEQPEELDLLVSQLLIRMTGEESGDLAQDILQKFRKQLPPGYGWPGNVRELEQAVRRILLGGHYSGDITSSQEEPEHQLMEAIRVGNLTMTELSKYYCQLLYGRHKTYESVARRLQLDRRTVKKYLESQ